MISETSTVRYAVSEAIEHTTLTMMCKCCAVIGYCCLVQSIGLHIKQAPIDSPEPSTDRGYLQRAFAVAVKVATISVGITVSSSSELKYERTALMEEGFSAKFHGSDS